MHTYNWDMPYICTDQLIEWMNKLLLVSLFLTALFSGVRAQSDSTNMMIDSLRMKMINLPAGKEKVMVYHELSQQYLEIDYEESVKYSELGLDMAIGNDLDSCVLMSKMDLAHIYLAYIQDYQQANKYFQESLELAEPAKDLRALVRIHRGLSYIYMGSGEFEAAKSENEKAMEYASQIGEYPAISSLNAYMGDLYEMSGDTASAITYYEKVLEIEQENNFSESTNISMVVIAHYYYLTGDTDQSLKYYRIALKRFQRIRDQRWTSYTHSEMAKVYVYEGQFERAEMHAMEGLGIAQEFKLRKELGDNYLILSVIYDSLEKKEKSAEYLAAYEALQDSLIPIQTAIEMTESEEPVLSAASFSPWSGFLQAFLMVGMVVLLVFLMGIPSRS